MQLPMKPIPVAIDADSLRRLFDAMQIFEKVTDGFFTARVFWQSRNTPRHLALGSVSQMWEYLNSEGRIFARAHQYQDSSGQPVPGERAGLGIRRP